MTWAGSRMVGPLVGLAFAWTVAGCGASHPLMPLALRQSWTYQARFGLSEERIETMTVVREVAVANGVGYELSGPLGVSRIGWRGRTLYADETANAFFNPSLPLVSEDSGTTAWDGVVTVDGQSVSAHATLETKPKSVKLTIAGHSYTTTLAVVKLQLPNRGEIELDSWYGAGIGLVQQEQRTNDDRVIQIQLVTAP